jgi:serine/threonine-protein kinase
VVYLGAFFAGSVVDRSYQALTVRAEATARDAAAKEALLVTARAELDRALSGAGEGLFTGTRVAGYLVGRLLGRGGMGEVYEGREVDGDERVAIKLLRRDRLGDARALRRFTIEASALRRVHSPYVAAVRYVSGADDDVSCIAMEYIDGVSLSALLRERERLEPRLVRSVIEDVGRGLHDVHRAGVIHRDVKPQNILLTDQGPGQRWKLVDFGAAKLVGPEAATTHHVIIGTPRYMAPEQVAGRADARSDLYSLCLVAYRALTGRPAFGGRDPVEIARVAAAGGPPDPSALVEISPDVALCLRIGLAAKPEDRFATASELLAAFDAAFDDRLEPHVRARARELLRRAPWG